MGSQDSLAQPGVRLQGYNLTTSPSAPHPPPARPAPPFNGTVIPNYNVVRQQCDACSQSATGCCIKGQPNLRVQYLSHKGATTLNGCAELCRTCTGCLQNGSGTGGRCHSFVWNSNNYDCFGRLDSLFDTHNPFYSHSAGLFSGTFGNESAAMATTAPGAPSGNAQMHFLPCVILEVTESSAVSQETFLLQIFGGKSSRTAVLLCCSSTSDQKMFLR